MSKVKHAKTILVTGGAGYIGSHIAFVAAKNGYNVVVLDKMLYGQSFDFAWATLVRGDYGDQELLQHVFMTYAVDVVIHCAGSIEVSESVKNPLKFYDNNVAKTAVLLQAMVDFGISKIIFSSSCAVYGRPQEVPITESHAQAPVSPYGQTKFMIETMLKDVERAHGILHVVFRFFNAAGGLPQEGLFEQHRPETHLIPLLLQAALEQKPFSIFGVSRPTPDGTCIRDYVHVLDIADAHMRALDYFKKQHTSCVFNLGTGKGFSVKEIIEAVENICSCSIIVQERPDREGDPAVLVAQAQRAHEVLGWQPRCSQLQAIIQSAYKGYLLINKNFNALTCCDYDQCEKT